MEMIEQLAKRMINDYDEACHNHVEKARVNDFGSFKHGQSHYRNALVSIPSPHSVCWEYRDTIFRRMIKDGVASDRAWEASGEACRQHIIVDVFTRYRKCENEILNIAKDWMFVVHEFSSAITDLPKEVQVKICDVVWSRAYEFFYSDGAVALLNGFDYMLSASDDIIAAHRGGGV